MSVLGQLVTGVRVRTTLPFGGLSVQDPFAGGATGAQPSLASRLLRPTVEVWLAGAETPLTYAPAGEPPWWGPFAWIAAGAALVAGGVALVKYLR